jgi:hypothetical protein
MAGLVGTTALPNLTPVAAEAGAAEGDPRPVYTWEGYADELTRPPEMGLICSYTPSDGGAPRLVALVGDGYTLGVWDTGTGAFLGALEPKSFSCLVTYKRPSDGRPRVAAGSRGGDLCIWDGDDFRVLHAIQTNLLRSAVSCLAVYEEPTSGRTRLITG